MARQARAPVKPKPTARTKTKPVAPSRQLKARTTKQDPSSDNLKSVVEEEDYDDEDDHDEANTSIDSYSTRKIKAVKKALHDKHQAEAEKCVSRAGKHCDDIMTRARHMIETTHPSEIAEIYSVLLEDIAKQDKIVMEAWKEVEVLDKETHDTVEKHYADLEKYAGEVEKVRKGCMATIEKQLQEEDNAVEVFKMALRG